MASGGFTFAPPKSGGMPAFPGMAAGKLWCAFVFSLLSVPFFPFFSSPFFFEPVFFRAFFGCESKLEQKEFPSVQSDEDRDFWI